ncbi:MAG: methionyl-tRNA formyltransferase [bacterium]
MKILFMGSPEISVPFLEFVSSKATKLIVFTQKDKVRKRGKSLEPTAVKKKALELGLPVFTNLAKSDATFEIVGNFAPDIIFVVAYGQILPKRILESAKIYPLNVHFSLLPKYRGATPVNSALLNGDLETGSTLMVMDEGLDTGDILLVEKCGIDKDDNATSLFKKLISLSIEMVEKNWENICKTNIKRVPQTGIPTLTKLIKKEDLTLDFSQDALAIHNKIRAFNYSPGVKTTFRGNALTIEKGEFVKECNAQFGEIYEVAKTHFTVACKNGGIKVFELKPAGKNSMTCAQFINGYKPKIGEILG